MYITQPYTTYVQQEPQIQRPLDTLYEDNDQRKKPLPKVPNINRHSTLVVGPSWTTGSIRTGADNGFGSVKAYLMNENTQQLEHQQNLYSNKQKTNKVTMLSPIEGYQGPMSEYPPYPPNTYYAIQPAVTQPENYVHHPVPPQSNSVSQEWKVSKNMTFKHPTVRRTDSLKIESSPIAPNEPQRLEKPDEPGILQRKVSKEEVCEQSEEKTVHLEKSNSFRLQPTSSEGLFTSASSVISESLSPSSSTSLIQKMSSSGVTLPNSGSGINLEKSNSMLNNSSIISTTDVCSQLSSLSRSATYYARNTKPSNLRVITDYEALGSADTPVTQIPNEPLENKRVNPISALHDPKNGVDHQDRFLESLKHSSLSIASYSLVQTKSNTKLYRRLAMKTRNHDIQMTFAKYLLQISKLYDSKTNLYQLKSQSEDDMVICDNNSNETPAQIRNRLLKEAGFWIERLSKSHWPEALYIKGRWHLLGRLQAPECVLPGYDKSNESKAFKCFMIASKGGWAEAHYELANLWKKRGHFAKAVRSYEKGAKENHTPSIYKMAKILLRGQLKEKKDVAKGLTYLKQAADAMSTDCAEPAFVLGCIYANEFDCIGITSNQDKQALRNVKLEDGDDYRYALKYMKKSAQFGYPDAIYYMGQISESGKLGQLCDVWQAYQYYSRAADLKHPGAMLDLSRLYCQGIPGLLAAQNDIAFKWCKRSADLGFDQAEFVLGIYYENGTGTEPDFPRALECFGRAASKGFQPAAEKLNQPLTSKAQQHHHIQSAKGQVTDASEVNNLIGNKRSTNNCVVQ